MLNNFERSIKLLTTTLNGATVNVFFHTHPFVGFVKIFTHYDACCGGVGQELRVRNLVNDEVLLDLDESNYSWSRGEDPGDDPYGYPEVGNLQIEVYDTPLFVIEVRGEDWRSNFDKHPMYDLLSQQSNKVIKMTFNKPTYYFLKWEETDKTKMVSVFDVPTIHEAMFVYT